MPFEIQSAVQKANWDPTVRVILLYGAGKTFSSGYDMKLFAEKEREGDSVWGSQDMPWDPATDYRWALKSRSLIYRYLL
jgi:enoyl-CoA hydratase